MNGRQNWGIPKEHAEFNWSAGPYGSQGVRVQTGGQDVLTARFRPFGFRVSLTTALLPLRLHQQPGGETFETKPTATGWGRLARVSEVD